MAIVKLDGLEIELPAESATAVQSYVRDSTRQLEAASTDRTALQARVDALQSELDALAQEKEAAEGRADALEEALEEAQAAATDRVDTAEIDKLVVARLDLLRSIAGAFPDNFKFDGLEEEALYTEAFKNLTGKEPREDAPLPYLQGVVQGILETRAAFDAGDPEDEEEEEPEEDEDEKEDRADSTASLRAALRGVKRADAVPTSDRLHAARRDDWKRPLSVHK